MFSRLDFISKTRQSQYRKPPSLQRARLTKEISHGAIYARLPILVDRFQVVGEVKGMAGQIHP